MLTSLPQVQLLNSRDINTVFCQSFSNTLEHIGSNSCFAKAHNGITTRFHPIIFLGIAFNSLWFRVPIISVTFNNKVSDGQVKINTPRTHKFLRIVLFSQMYQYLFNSDFDRSWFLLGLQTSCKMAGFACTRTKLTPSVDVQARYDRKGFTAIQAGKRNLLASMRGFVSWFTNFVCISTFTRTEFTTTSLNKNTLDNKNFATLLAYSINANIWARGLTTASYAFAFQRAKTSSGSHIYLNRKNLPANLARYFGACRWKG